MDGVYCNNPYPTMAAAGRPNRSTQAFDSDENQSNQFPTLVTAVGINGNSTPDTFYLNPESHQGVEAKWKGVARSAWTHWRNNSSNKFENEAFLIERCFLE